MNRLSIAATFLLGAALFSAVGAGAQASEVVPKSLARQLDRQVAEFTMTEAKRRRLMMMHETERQKRYHERRRGYGYGYPAYSRPHRAPPPYGYGRRNDRW